LRQPRVAEEDSKFSLLDPRLPLMTLQVSPFPAGCLHGPWGPAQDLRMLTLWLRIPFKRGAVGKGSEKVH
jgi:hypothetical protein